MEKRYLLFDLDGTLTDPKVGITKSIRYALRSYGIEEENMELLCSFIGPPLRDSFMRYYGFDEAGATEAIDRYREYFEAKGLYENEEYPGIREVLKELKEAGYSLMVATSKPEVFAERILRHFGLDIWFDFVGGADLDETRVRKADVIRYVLEQNEITELDRVVMIGDREHDVLGAGEVGIASVGVLYGYGSRQELTAAGAGRLVETVDGLRVLLEAPFACAGSTEGKRPRETEGPCSCAQKAERRNGV